MAIRSMGSLDLCKRVHAKNMRFTESRHHGLRDRKFSLS